MPPRGTSVGCWICRLRRKKCDQFTPTCKECASLGLQCHYSNDKPTWMDGAEQQKLMSTRLKDEIKRNAALRRRTKKIRCIERELDASIELPRNSPFRPCSLEDTIFQTSSPSRAQDTDTAFPTPPESAEHDPPGHTDTRRLNPIVHQVPTLDADFANAYNQPDFEPSLLMSYLDYAFPILFPFYRPSILEGGRAWLLTLALKYPAFYHNIVGLAAYFYCAVPVIPGPEHDACAVKAQTELRNQMEKAVQGVQDSLRGVTQAGTGNSLSENVRLLGNIVQLVTFEVTFASSENWQIHQTAAVTLLDQTLTHFSGVQTLEPKLVVMLQRLRCNVPMNCSVWSAEQAALRFFSAMVIYQDIIASTTHGQAPKLFKHYDDLLVNLHSADRSKFLHLEEFVGCQTWVLRSIAEIASLGQWKRTCKEAGSLDMIDLVNRANHIQEALHDGVANLEATASTPPQRHISPYRPLETILTKSDINHGSSLSLEADHSIVSRIWTHAAHVYLIVVLSGWQPGNVQLRNQVAQALQLLDTIDNPSWLRTLAWPFCILGCFATEEQEDFFRNVADASGGLAMFGTLRDALAIMEKVWSGRNQHGHDTWDIASCLRILGHSVLLV